MGEGGEGGVAVGNHRGAMAENTVEKRGLAHVRASDDADYG